MTLENLRRDEMSAWRAHDEARNELYSIAYGIAYGESIKPGMTTDDERSAFMAARAAVAQSREAWQSARRAVQEQEAIADD